MSNPMNNLSYGLFVLTANDGKDNGCIINTACQVTSNPNRITVAVNKDNYTCAQILKSGVFNLSVLTQSVKFDLFKRFGFSSGKDTNKFADYLACKRAKNGVLYITEGVNTVICAKVITTTDLGTHILFLADVNEATIISDEPSVTYAYYHANVKPKPQASAKAQGDQPIYRCTICGYEHKGELPDGFLCPLCRHPKEDFVRV